MRYWLMKSEPDVFGVDDLARGRVVLEGGVDADDPAVVHQDRAIGEERTRRDVHDRDVPDRQVGEAIGREVARGEECEARCAYRAPEAEHARSFWWRHGAQAVVGKDESSDGSHS